MHTARRCIRYSITVGATMLLMASAQARSARIYVSSELSGEIASIDPATEKVIERIKVGKRPRGLRLLKDGRHLLVALSGSPVGGPGVDESSLPPPDRNADGIGVIDLQTRTLERVLTSGPDPETFDLSADERTVYVSNEDSAALTVVDFSTGKIKARVSICREPEGVSVRPPYGHEVFVTCEADGAVAVVDASTLKLKTITKTGARPRAILFTHDGATAFITNEFDNSISVMDARTPAVVATIPLRASSSASEPSRPMGMAMSPDGRTLYVTTGRGGAVAVIDVHSKKLLRTFESMGERPWGIGLSADARKLYTANGTSDDVSIIDAASGRVVKRIAVGGRPWGVAVADK